MIHFLLVASSLTVMTFPRDAEPRQPVSLQSKHQEQGRKHEPKYGFSIKPPATWKEQKSEDPKVMLEYMGPLHNGFIANVNIRRIAYSGKPLSSIGESIAVAQKKLQKFQLIERKEVAIEGSKALRSIVQFSTMIDDKELEVRSMQYFIISANKKHSFVVTFTTLPDQFESMRKEFEECANSIKTD